MATLPRVNIGIQADSRDADPIRTAFEKVNTIADHLEPIEAAVPSIEQIFNAATGVPETVADSAYTIAAADLGKTKRFSNACVITLPADLPAGFYVHCRRVGTGAVTWVADTGATKHEYPSGSGIASQWASIMMAVDSNADDASGVWIIEGAIA